MQVFQEVCNLGYILYANKTAEEMDGLSLDSNEVIMEQTLLLKWFREKHGLFPTIVMEDKNKWKVILWKKTIYLDGIREKFPTFEEAQTNALVKIIETLKTKAE